MLAQGLKDALVHFEGGLGKPLSHHDPYQIHELLMQFRKEHDLPPWHIITEYFRDVARESAQSMGLKTINISWIHPSYTGAKTLELHDDSKDTDSWVWFIARVRNDNVLSLQEQVVVCPKRKIVWSVGSERITGSVKIAYPEECGKNCYRATSGALIKLATNLIRKKMSKYGTSGEQIITVKSMAASVKKPEKEVKPPQLDEWFKAQPEIGKTVTAAEIEQITTMFDIARHAALELGMTNTVDRWQQTIDKLKG